MNSRDDADASTNTSRSASLLLPPSAVKKPLLLNHLIHSNKSWRDKQVRLVVTTYWLFYSSTIVLNYKILEQINIIFLLDSHNNWHANINLITSGQYWRWALTSGVGCPPSYNGCMSRTRFVCFDGRAMEETKIHGWEGERSESWSKIANDGACAKETK